MADQRGAGDVVSDSDVTPHDLIERFCKLQSRVMREVFVYSSANDCFCGERQSWVEEGIWRNEQTAVAWIENVVNEAIEKAKEPPVEVIDWLDREGDRHVGF